jgi:predicted house-cleaning noncanonical NTP pyrophosphatase (MazG superfamily)
VARTIYNKLVRDRIPEIIEAQGKRPHVRRYEQSEFVGALKQKLAEEASEARQATEPTDLLIELADVLEVVHALAAALSINVTEIERERDVRRRERGGFDQRVCLLAVEDTSGTEGKQTATRRRDRVRSPCEQN